ncbi:PRC-barrel domain-containing protein [Candidatus Gracilibacteria bacterium]|nr:PRC-barrel domain-containing protein [Candidatus Gracilibacteria bacterium]
MEKFYSKIIGTPILAEEGFRPIASVKDVVMDPERGKVIAFVVDKGKVIVPFDVLSWGDAIRVHDHDAIVESEDVLRVKEVQDSGVKISGNKVETEEGKVLGKVLDFSVNSKTMEIKKLYVGRTILGLIKFETRLIPAKNIIEVLEDKIIVKDDMAVVREEEEVAVGDVATL